MVSEKISGWYIFDERLPAKTVTKAYDDGGIDLTYLYDGNGSWRWFNNPESWDMNAVKSTKKEVSALIAKVDGKS